MIKLKLIAALACIGLAACQPTEPINNNVSTGTPVGPERCGLAAGTLVDERVLYGAETAYNVPAHAYVTADATGRLPADIKARARPLLIEAYRHLQLARAAYRLGDVCSLNAAAVAARGFADRAKAILPR